MSAQSFEGTESNLSGALERSSKTFESTTTPSPLHHLISKFLNIVDFCYFDKHPPDHFLQVKYFTLLLVISFINVVQDNQ